MAKSSLLQVAPASPSPELNSGGGTGRPPEGDGVGAELERRPRAAARHPDSAPFWTLPFLQSER